MTIDETVPHGWTGGTGGDGAAPGMGTPRAMLGEAMAGSATVGNMTAGGSTAGNMTAGGATAGAVRRKEALAMHARAEGADGAIGAPTFAATSTSAPAPASDPTPAPGAEADGASARKAESAGGDRPAGPDGDHGGARAGRPGAPGDGGNRDDGANGNDGENGNGGDDGGARARLGTRLTFFAAGFLPACWAPLIPFVKDRVGAGEGTFGLLLLCIGIGSIASMPVTGWVSARHGARPMILAGGLLSVALLPLLPLAPGVAPLGVALVLFGMAMGSLDVAMNVHAVEAQRLSPGPVMSGFHALFSIGNFAGAGAMTLVLMTGLGPVPAALLGAALALAALLAGLPRLLRGGGAEPGPAFALPRGVVLLLAGLCTISFLTEGAMLDWGALLVIERDLVRAEGAGLGFMLFSGAMLTARLAGDRMVARLGERRVLVGGGLVLSAGIVLLVAAPLAGLAMAGFVLVGLGAANMVPVFFSAAARQEAMPAAAAIAAVSTTGYAGILAGPALLGFAAEATSLGTTFWALAALALAIPLAARRVVAG